MPSIKIYDAKDFPSYLPKLGLLYDDLFTGGKGFRAQLVQLFCGSLRAPEATIHLLSQTVEFIHNASLLHDDLIDSSELRRGKTAAWLKYTPEYAVLAGDYLLARVMVNLSGFGNIRLVQYTAEVISDLLEGEWLQDSLVGDADVQLAELDRVHNLKTASLFKWCMRAPFMAMNVGDDKLQNSLEEVGTLLGQLFQRGDDLLDFDVRNGEGKALLGDLKYGYFNSFASFATANLGAEKRRQIQKLQTLPEFINALGGEKSFNERVSEFDQVNQKKIALYKHHLEQVKSHITPDLLEKLLSLPDLLYWRKKK